MLAYYVAWHMREAWHPLLFADEEQAATQIRDPVAPATRSAAALRNVPTKVLDAGPPVHSFSTLLTALSNIVRNVCRPRRAGPDALTFEIVTTPTPTQQRAFDLLKTVMVSTEACRRSVAYFLESTRRFRLEARGTSG